MRSSQAAALLLLLAAGPALADGSRLTGLPSALLGGAAAEGTQHELPKPPVPSIAAGPATIVLGQTALADVQAALGGTLRHAADGPVSADWLCFNVAGAHPQHVWIVSDGQSGGASRLVTLVGANFGDPLAACDAAGNGLDGLKLSAPGLGATEADLAAAFGAVVAPRNGMVAYTSQSPEEGGVTISQSLNYLLDGTQTIIGVAASQIAAH